MSEEKHDEKQVEPQEGRPADTGQRVTDTAARIGHLLGRTAHRATQLSGQAAQDARPEVERIARSARAAADTIRPRVEQAGRSAIQYVRDHDADIKRAARISAEVTAHQVMPLKLRPIVAAIESDRWKRAPLRDHRDTAELSSEPSRSPDRPSGPDVPHVAD